MCLKTSGSGTSTSRSAGEAGRSVPPFKKELVFKRPKHYDAKEKDDENDFQVTAGILLLLCIVFVYCFMIYAFFYARIVSTIAMYPHSILL